MKVKIIEPCYADGEGRKVGDVIDTKKGSLLIGLRKAVAYTGEEPEQEVSEVLVSDSVRNLAIENGVDLTQIEGSGKNGRITKGDVESAIASRDDESESLTQR